jgi:molybdenum cofactor cytidylyltransferase
MAEVAAILLAAGRASRWRASGGREATKLVAPWRGRAMAHAVAEAALASRARPLVVVLGHEAAAVRAALDGLPAVFVENRDYAQGLSTSLRAGLAALPECCDGAVVLLGDMPEVGADLIDALIAAFEARPDALAVAPRGAGGLGKPVLLARGLFAQAAALSGDRGARRLVERAGARRVEIDWAGEEIALDIDEARG